LLPTSTTSQFLHIGHHTAAKGRGIEPHAHPFHELIVMLAGTLHLEMRGETVEAHAGDVLHYPAGWVHDETMSATDPVEHHFIGFLWPAWTDDLPLAVHDQQGRIGTLAKWLYQEREAPGPGKAAADAAFMQAIIAEYVRLGAAGEQPLVARLRAHMRRRLTASLTLDDLAAYARISKFHLVRRYKELTGRTPMQDLRHLRVQAARDLLLTTDLPLRQISQQTGLRDEQHLSRLFRRIFGTAPGSYRQTAKQRRRPMVRGSLDPTDSEPC
jgi:AraC-like DNA-binding protein/mannose-6-phosphate isomerase-like protein (cupin superfamily)